MALPNDESIFSEVDQDLRRERLRQWAKGVGRYVLAISVLILLGTVAIVGYQHYEEQKAQGLTATLTEASGQLSQNHEAEALSLLERVAKADHPTLSVLARLWTAQILAERDRTASDAALQPLNAKLDDTDPYKQYAALLSAGDDAVANLKPEGNTPFSATLRERRAMALLRLNRKEDAAAAFRELAEGATTPPSMRERASLFLSALLAETTPAPKS